jgi:hypothetical protein
MRVDVLGYSLETGMLYKHGRDHDMPLYAFVVPRKPKRK